MNISVLCYRAIIDWVEADPQRVQKSPRLDHFDVADMANTRFDQLQLRLGYPYSFCHYGNCEHILVFNDLRYALSAVKCLYH